jgi:NAD(P)-dependent dehydrogenase (short-subunit alcohol dehydrogenase family)
MSGTFAFMAEPGTSAHCAAKAAVLAFTRAVAAEYGDRNIRCNALVPGYVMTDMVRRLFDRSDDGEAVHAEIASWHDLGRIADPREVANMALFLCSDESSFSSGSPFFVDGGLTTGINSNRHPLARAAQPAARSAG